jgi:hypothetical protein
VIRILRTKKDVCHECNKHGHGVEFELFYDQTNVSFLCWEHFRLNTDILMEAGILPRHLRPRPLLDPHGPLAQSVLDGVGETEGRTPRNSHTIGIGSSRSWSEGRSRGVSHGQSESAS